MKDVSRKSHRLKLITKAPLSLCLLATFLVSSVVSQTKQPIRKSDLVRSLRMGGVTAKEYIQRVGEYGVDFQLTPSIEQDIRRAGKNLRGPRLNDLIATIRSNFRPTKSLPSGVTATAPVSQSMINSPGGIQATGDVFINSDRRLIHSLSIRISVNAETQHSEVTKEAVDVGLRSIIGLFTEDNTRIRFVTDFTLSDQQITSTLRRISFVYAPETPTEILGREIAFLETVKTLAVNYSDIFKTTNFAVNKERTKLYMSVLLNGIEVISHTADGEPGVLASGQATLDVSSIFKRAPEVYDQKVSVKPGRD